MIVKMKTEKVVPSFSEPLAFSDLKGKEETTEDSPREIEVNGGQCIVVDLPDVTLPPVHKVETMVEKLPEADLSIFE